MSKSPLKFLGITQIAKQTPVNSDVFDLHLGDGYSSFDKMSVGQTALNNLQEIPVIYSDIQNTIDLTNTVDREDLIKDLNVDISVSGGWGDFSASGSAHYLHHTEDTDYTDNFTYLERFYTDARLDISELPHDVSAFTKAAQNEYKQYGIKKFTDIYGDKFVQKLPLGALLAINIQIHFSSALDKTSFNGAIKGGFGSLFNASSTIQKVVTRSHASGSVEVSAYQLGGDPSQLPDIFKKDPSGKYHIVGCTLDNLDECSKAIGDIIDYAQGKFSKQISVVGGKPQGNLATVGEPTLGSYMLEFNIDPPPLPDPAIIAARMKLVGMYNETFANKVFVDHLLHSRVAQYIIASVADALKAAQDNLNWNYSLFDQFGAISCYLPGEESQCPSIVDYIVKYSKPVDQDLLNYFENTGYIIYDINSHWYASPLDSGVKDTKAFFFFTPTVDYMFATFQFKNESQILQLQAHEIPCPDSWTGTLQNVGEGIYKGDVYPKSGHPDPWTLEPRQNPA